MHSHSGTIETTTQQSMGDIRSNCHHRRCLVHPKLCSQFDKCDIQYFWTCNCLVNLLWHTTVVGSRLRVGPSGQALRAIKAKTDGQESWRRRHRYEKIQRPLPLRAFTDNSLPWPLWRATPPQAAVIYSSHRRVAWHFVPEEFSLQSSGSQLLPIS